MYKNQKFALLTSICTILFIVIFSTNVSAAYVSDKEGNPVDNSVKEVAFTLTENTLYNSLTFTLKREYSCFLEKKGDEGWYKVYLTSGSKALTIYAPYVNINAKIFDSKENLVYENNYGKGRKRKGKFNLANPGVYYIKVTSNDEITKRVAYTMLIGAPEYKTDNYTKKLSTTTLTSTRKTSPVQTFNLINEKSIPNTAVIKTISLGGTEKNKHDPSNKTRFIRINNKNWFQSTGPVFFDINMFNATSPTLLKQTWQFKHSISSTSAPYSLTPSITFTYLYESDE